MTSTLCVDIGNYSVLSAVVSGGESSNITLMRSLIYDATHNSECRNNAHPQNSPLVVVNGKSFKVGNKASLYPGFLSAAEAGKSRTDIILPILLANTPNEFEGTVKMLVPVRDELKEKLIFNEVVGTHTYSVTCDGHKIDSIANFIGIEFVRETDAAAKFAYEIGVINPDDVVLVIDIGGGTTNIVIASYEYDVFNIIFRKSYDNSGGIQLAQTIANTDLAKSYGKAFEIAKIMDAISEGKRFYGNRKDYSFLTVWEESVEQWFDALLSRVMASADKYLDEVTTILWCGGGSEIIRSKVLNQPGHVILDNPQLANINGLIHSVKPQIRIAA